MDKNTIIGFILIGIVLFGFSWWNRPTPEQLEAQQRYQDSIAQIELARFCTSGASAEQFRLIRFEDDRI